MSSFAHVLWAVVAVAVVYRITEVWEKFAPQPVSDVSSPAQIAVGDIPEDLMALATAETEVWAQEEMVRVIQERYEALRDWQRVRAAMGIGRIDE